MTTLQIYTILEVWIHNILTSNVIVVAGEQNMSKPANDYFVLHQPMSLIEYSSGNYSMADNTGKITYTNHWQATITLEEIGYKNLNGDKLRTLLNSLRLQDTKDYFRNSKVSILRHEGIKPIPQLSENIWELRSTLDLIILFPDEGTFQQGFIETVEFEGTYNT